MRFELGEEQREFQRSLRELLQREYSARAAWTGETRSIWKRLAELGVLGVTLPESAGLGGNSLDWILLAEEAGRAALAHPLSDAWVAGPLLSPEQQRRLGEGELTVTVALDTPSVPDADLFVVRQGEQLHAIPRSAATVRKLASIDGARHLVRLEWNVLHPIAGDWRVVFDQMALATAAELIGLGQHLLEATVEYVKVRQQFGQPIGSFQAVKHHLANALLGLEFARPFVYRAAYEFSTENVSMAKASASDAAHQVTRAALQCHGAIGYSFEHDLHLWMKRVWALEAAWGSAAWHRERVACRILDGEPDEDRLSR